VENIALAVYVAAVLVLFVKAIVAMTIQGRERLRGGTFRYPEDATHWKGEVAPDSDRCERAQRLLRNDGESQPYFLVLGALVTGPTAVPRCSCRQPPKKRGPRSRAKVDQESNSAHVESTPSKELDVATDLVPSGRSFTAAIESSIGRR